MTPDAAQLFETLDATWPAGTFKQHGPWCIREGLGGGQRVSAATASGAVSDSDIETAEAAMRAIAQRPLFMIRPQEDDLDGMLERRGYHISASYSSSCAIPKTWAVPVLPAIS